MEVRGLFIEDEDENGILKADVSEILSAIHNGDSYHWGIVFLDVLRKEGLQDADHDLINTIGKTTQLYPIKWKELVALCSKFDQVIDGTFIGCKDEKKLHPYKTNQEMYEACDIVIQMVDCTFCTVFTHQKDLLDRLAKRYKDTQFLEVDERVPISFPVPHQHMWVKMENGSTRKKKAEPVADWSYA